MMTEAATPMPEAPIPADLTMFLAESRDAREYRRGMAVKLILQGRPYVEIAGLLDVTQGFLSQMKQRYQANGVAGLRLRHQGGKPFLDPTARASVIDWLRTNQTWSLLTLKQYLLETHQVVFQSDQSYYALFAAADIHYKKTQARNPKQNPEQIAAKKTTL
jgi:putative transposase